MTVELQHVRARVTLPASIVAYSIGDHVSNSATVAGSDWLSFPIPRGVRAFAARKLTAVKSTTVVTNAQFRLHLLSALPTARIADDAVLSAMRLDSKEHYLGYFDFTFSPTLGDFAMIDAAPAVGERVLLIPDDNSTWEDEIRYCYGVFEAKAAYTRAASDIFDFALTGDGEVEEA